MNSPSLGKNGQNQKTHLIQSYVAFIYPLYTHKLLAINTSYGAYDESIQGEFWNFF
jgi:hypothetical protein